MRTANLDVVGTNDKFAIPGSSPAGSPRDDASRQLASANSESWRGCGSTIIWSVRWVG